MSAARDARAALIAAGLGTILVGGWLSGDDPPFGEANLPLLCGYLKEGAVAALAVAAVTVGLAATRLKALALGGIALIALAMVVTLLLGEEGGYSMGSSGWVSGFVSVLVVVPVAIVLELVAGLASLAELLERGRGVRRAALIAALLPMALGLIYLFCSHQPPDISALVAALGADENRYGRIHLASRLWELDDERLQPLLLPLLEDDDPRVREAAALALSGRSRRATTVPPLLAALAREEDPQCREWLVRSLGGVAPLAEGAEREAALTALIETLGRGETAVRGAAAEALVQLREPRAIPPLIAALADPEVNFHAHNALLTLTGERLGSDPGAWQAWWAKRQGR